MPNKAGKRWGFLLSGYVWITRYPSDDDEVAYMLVETEMSATKCYSPEEVNTAVDIAMYYAQYDQYPWMH